MNKLSQTPKTNIQQPLRICLIGFMGAGKTVTAQVLAEELTGADWIDLDEFIEVRENRHIGQMIENLGENAFREIETDALREVIKLEGNMILALGGGTWTIEENREVIEAANYIPVWLDASFELCWKRISEAKENRPLARLKTKTQQLFSSRRKIYQTAKIKVKVSKDKTPGDVALGILKLISQPKPKRPKPIDKTGVSR
ncbi:MAG: shikimate kinase [Pyrinomonadaceae bacterium]